MAKSVIRMHIEQQPESIMTLSVTRFDTNEVLDISMIERTPYEPRFLISLCNSDVFVDDNDIGYIPDNYILQIQQLLKYENRMSKKFNSINENILNICKIAELSDILVEAEVQQNNLLKHDLSDLEMVDVDEFELSNSSSLNQDKFRNSDIFPVIDYVKNCLISLKNNSFWWFAVIMCIDGINLNEKYDLAEFEIRQDLIFKQKINS